MVNRWIRRPRVQRYGCARCVSTINAWIVVARAIPAQVIADRDKLAVSVKFYPIFVFGESVTENAVEKNEMEEIAAATLAKSDGANFGCP